MTYLRSVGIIPTILCMMLASACSHHETGLSPSRSEKGSVSLALTQDGRTYNIATKADGTSTLSSLPPIDSFRIEIYNADKIRLYNQKYEKAKSDLILLNTGDYRMVAHYGDSLGAGISKPYFLADTTFEVISTTANGGKPQQIKSTAKLANVMTAVTFGENIKSYYADWYAVVKHEKYTKKSVTFTKNETRTGNIPGGRLYLEVYVKMPSSSADAGKLRYYKTEPVEYAPADFVTFHVETGAATGSLKVNIKVDNSVEIIEKEHVIPYMEVPGDKPSFSYAGESAPQYTLSFQAGMHSAGPADISFLALKGTKSVTVKVESDYLGGQGFTGSEAELVNANASDKQSLAAAGVEYVVEADARLGYVSLAGLMNVLDKAKAYDLTTGKTCATVTITVTDNLGQSTSAVFNVKPEKARATVSVADYNVWGWKIVEPHAVFDVETLPQDLNAALQYKLPSENSWHNAAIKSVKGNEVVFNDLTGLVAGQSYEIRTIVDDNEYNTCSQQNIATEYPTQVYNGGFEEFAEQTTITDVVLSNKDMTVKWWQMNAAGSDPWWGVNSTISILKVCSISNQDFKTYPTIQVIDENGGAFSGHSVIVATVSVYRDAVSNPDKVSARCFPGELFIGTGNNELTEQAAFTNTFAINWSRTSEGHAFPTRPSALEFVYKFDMYKIPYYADIQILDASGNVIGSASVNDQNSTVSNWTKKILPIKYTVFNKKAASIRINFMSENERNESDKDSRNYTVTTLSGKHTIHAGSVLYLDDIKLKYE